MSAKNKKSAEQKAEEYERMRKKQAERQAAMLKRRKRRAEIKAERDRIAKIRAEQRATKRRARIAFYKKIRKKLSNSPFGFDYFNYGMLPRTELFVEGDGAAVCDRLIANGIKVADFNADGRKCSFKIRTKDLRKAIALSDGICYNCKVGKCYGIVRAAKFWGARFGLCLGAAVAVAGMILSYSYVWRIEISGNEGLSDAAVEHALYDAGYRTLQKKNGIDPDAVAAAVSGMDGVADASAQIVGTTLYVYVLEAENYTVHERYSSYASDYDATVTKVVVRSGTAGVSRGDVVKKGDILADGNVYSTAGELLSTGECDAEIYGQVSVVFTARLGTSSVQYVRTGNSTVKTGYTLFGYKLGKTASPYTSYDSELSTSRYDVLVPLYATTYRYYETAPVTVERTIDEAVNEFAAKQIEQMQFEGEYVSSYTVGEQSAGLYTVHLFLSGETLISRGIK